MLQQTQVSRVIPFYERFLERFPTVQILAEANWEEFLPYYQGLGYYARGRNMLKTAQLVCENFDGVFPKNREQLLSLPGIGEYTADAILSFGYGEKRLAVDTNLKRVLGRYIAGSKSASLDWENLRTELSSSAPEINGAFMDFANLVCTRKPHCSICPLARQCVYAQSNGSLEAVVKRGSSQFPSAEAQTILVLHENHRKYFSVESERFVPFVLPAPLNTRPRIREYFARQYGLQLSIRPPRAKGYWQEKPTQLVFAQILSGSHSFEEFAAEKAKIVWQEILVGLDA